MSIFASAKGAMRRRISSKKSAVPKPARSTCGRERCRLGKKSFLKTRKRVLTAWTWNSWIANIQWRWSQPSVPSKAALLGEGPKDLTSGVIAISNESGWLIWLIYHQAKRHDWKIRGTTKNWILSSSETTDIGRFLRDEILHALQGLSLYLCK